MPAVVADIASPEMITVPAGTFWMGAADADDKFASVLEKPRHAVTVDRAFSIGRYPVTFDEWDVFVEARRSPSPGTPGEGGGEGEFVSRAVFDTQKHPHPNPLPAYQARGPEGAHRPDDRGFGRGRLPVFNVSWTDAMLYIDWLNHQTGRRFRLPSEAEWEYCCRAGTDGVFATGSRLSVDRANYLYTDFREKPGLGRPSPVGSYPANGFGLHDMHGNVCELVADTWHAGYDGAPCDGTAWATGDPSRRVVRNGGWDAMPRILRCAFRDWIPVDQRLDNTGFRLACD